jgi:hypothetical protein
VQRAKALPKYRGLTGAGFQVRAPAALLKQIALIRADGVFSFRMTQEAGVAARVAALLHDLALPQTLKLRFPLAAGPLLAGQKSVYVRATNEGDGWRADEVTLHVRGAEVGSVRLADYGEDERPGRAAKVLPRDTFRVFAAWVQVLEDAVV